MSTLKTNNLEHLDATSPNITLGIGGGVNISGIATAENGLRIGSTADAVIGFGTDETNKKISIGSTGAYLQRHGIGVYNPHTLGLRNGILVHNNKAYSNTSSYRTAAFKAVGVSGNALGISTDANDNGLSGTLNAYIKFNGSAYFGGDVGIGTDNPTENVSVAGTIRVQDSTDATQYLTINHQGIDFQNTGAGSSTAATSHLLDDYEEGTWTPTLSSETVSNIDSRYRKIGSVVTLYTRFDVTSLSNIADGDRLSNLGGYPFSKASGSNLSGHGGTTGSSGGQRWYLLTNQNAIKCVSTNGGTMNRVALIISYTTD